MSLHKLWWVENRCSRVLFEREEQCVREKTARKHERISIYGCHPSITICFNFIHSVFDNANNDLLVSSSPTKTRTQSIVLIPLHQPKRHKKCARFSGYGKAWKGLIKSAITTRLRAKCTTNRIQSRVLLNVWYFFTFTSQHKK